jgi:hypothetical protein
MVSEDFYLFEFEIKTSWEDFVADLRKKKHKFYSRFRSDPRNPNYFYYVCPAGEIPLDSVPNHAGLIYIHHEPRSGISSFAGLIKTAPLINPRRLSKDRLKWIAAALSWRFGAWGVDSEWG